MVKSTFRGRNLTESDLKQVRNSFNPNYVSQELFDNILANLDKQPYFTREDLQNKPKDSSGLTVCISDECRRVYWETPGNPGCFVNDIPVMERQGPYCRSCSHQVTLPKER